jgi:hypothetical protein
VDQRIDRPFPNTIQFLNLVKRDSYVYRGKFDYDGPGGARLDYAEMWVEMNQSLPDSLLDWPKFISDSTEDLKPNLVRMTLANGSFGEVQDGSCDSLVQTLDFVDGLGRRYVDEHGDEDPMETLVLTGAKCLAMPSGSMTIVRAEEWVDGVQCFPAQSDYQRDGDATDDLWTTNRDLFVQDLNEPGCDITDVGGQKFYFNMEMYVINNDGKILNAQSDFANSSYDPFTVLKNTAVEGILSVTDAGTDTGGNGVIGGASVLQRGNFDLVVTPDIVLMAVEKVAAVLGDIDTGSSGSGI